MQGIEILRRGQDLSCATTSCGASLVRNQSFDDCGIVSFAKVLLNKVILDLGFGFLTHLHTMYSQVPIKQVGPNKRVEYIF